MLSLAEFVPDRAAEEAVVRALDEMRRVYTNQGCLDELQGAVADVVMSPDPQVVHAHRAEVCRDHFVMLHAAETDCVPLFRLRIEDVGDRSNLEFFLQEAGLHGAARVIRYLGEQGADVNAVQNDNQRMTALHWAVYQLHSDAVAALIAHPEIDLERVDARGRTALDLALHRRGHTESAELLAAAGARISPDTVVSVARSQGLPFVEIVLRHGADPNAYGPKTGIAPLHAAVSTHHLFTVQRLLQAGADPLLPTRRIFRARGVKYPRGATPLDYLDLADPGGINPAWPPALRELLTRAVAERTQERG
ncbi:ankyrin repeat domain-containing protein [Nonomuraea longicatena]